MKTSFRIVLFAMFALVLTPAKAEQWGVGAAIAHLQPVQNGLAGEYISIPYITYHGEHLNIDLTTLSYTLLRSKSYEISMAGEFRYEGYDPKDSPALTGMDKRHPAFDAGFSLAHATLGGQAKIILLTDITDTHEGQEIRAQYQRPFMFKRLLIAPALGISWLNNELVDYYYGVRSHEVTGTRPFYEGQATSNTYVELTMGYVLSERLELLGGLKYVHLGKGIETSPIVDQRYETNAFTAVQYKF